MLDIRPSHVDGQQDQATSLGLDHGAKGEIAAEATVNIILKNNGDNGTYCF